MRNYFQVVSLLLFVLFLTFGCKLDTSVELYVGDILDAFSEDLSTQGRLKAYMSSEKVCTENKEKVVKIISSYMGEVKEEGCQSEGMSNFLVLAVNFPVTSQDNTNLYHIFVTGSESNAQVFLKLNREKFNGLNAEIDKEFNDGIDLDESTIHIKLVNDQRKSITMISNSVFINKNPILESELLIDRRKSIDIEFSNVHSAHFEKNNEVKLFNLLMK